MSQDSWNVLDKDTRPEGEDDDREAPAYLRKAETPPSPAKPRVSRSQRHPRIYIPGVQTRATCTRPTWVIVRACEDNIILNSF